MTGYAQQLACGAWKVTPDCVRDARGSVRELVWADALREATGHGLEVAQAHCTVSHRGVVRGIRYAQGPPGQAKIISCVSGAVLDAVVDLRTGSPTFGRWHLERLEGAEPGGLFLPEGLGHATLALSEDAVVVYLLSATGGQERRLDPLDAELGIAWPPGTAAGESAPGLAQARRAGHLPRFDSCAAPR